MSNIRLSSGEDAYLIYLSPYLDRLKSLYFRALVKKVKSKLDFATSLNDF